jgi:hypothetical protein
LVFFPKYLETLENTSPNVFGILLYGKYFNHLRESDGKGSRSDAQMVIPGWPILVWLVGLQTIQKCAI